MRRDWSSERRSRDSATSDELRPLSRRRGSRQKGDGDDQDDEDAESDDTGGDGHDHDPDSYSRADSFRKRLALVVHWHCEEDEREDVGLCPYLWYLLKWLVPGFSFSVCFFLQCYCLHIATFFYIKWMTRLEQSISSNSTTTDDQLSSVVAQGSLHDVSALILGYHEIPTAVMDTISATIPVCWIFLVVHALNLHLFTKSCLCGSLLALGKGCLAVVTVVPDSIGWTACKQRLGPEAVDWFRDEQNMNFRRNFMALLKDFLMLEVFGVSRDHPLGLNPLRFCADMIYSGHTYVAALFSLGLYDYCKVVTRRCSRQKKFFLRTLTGIILSGIVLTDACLMLLNQFHYTLDVVLAILLALLFYTNAAIARTAVWWADEVWVKRGKRLRVKSELQDDDDGDVLIPPCCIPFCLMSGRFAIVKHGDEALWYRAIQLHTWHLAVAAPERFDEFMREVLAFHGTRTPATSVRLHRHDFKDLQETVKALGKAIQEVQASRGSGRMRVEDLIEHLSSQGFHGGSATLLGMVQGLAPSTCLV